MIIYIYILFIIITQKNKQFREIFVTKKKQKVLNIAFGLCMKEIITTKKQLFEIF